MRLDQITWTPHGKDGQGRTVEITKTVWDRTRTMFAIMRVALRHPTHVAYEYRVYRGGADLVSEDIHDFLKSVLPFDPKGMGALEIKCWLLENTDEGG